MASKRDLGQAYVSIVPNLDKFKSQLQTGLKKAVAGTSADVKIDADTKPLTDSVKKASKQVNADMVKLRDQAKGILADGLKFDIDANDAKAVAKIDGLKAKLLEFSKMSVEGKTDVDVAKAQAKLSGISAELDAFSKKRPTVTVTVKTNQSLLSKLWSGVERDAEGSGDKSGRSFTQRLEAALGGNGNGGGISGAFAKLFSGGDKAANDSGNSSGNSFVKSFVSHIGNQGYWIAGAVAVGLAALPAAIGVVGALSGVALGAGIIAMAVSEISKNKTAIATATAKVTSDKSAVASASKVTGAATPNSLLSQKSSNAILANSIKQLNATKQLTAAQKTTLANDKISLATGQKKLSNLQAQNGSSSAALGTDKQKLATDQASLAALQKQQAALAKFQAVSTDLSKTWTTLKNTLFTSVSGSGFLDSVVKSINQFKTQIAPIGGLLKTLFKNSAGLVQPFVTALEDLVKGVLPGLNNMLGRTGGTIGSLVVGIGKLIGTGLGQWFEAAEPYMKSSSTYFLMLLKGAVGLGTGIIKLGGILSQILVPVIRLLEPIVGQLVGNFGKTGSTLVGILLPAIEKIGPPLVKLAASILTVSAEFTGTLLTALKPVVQGLSTMIAVTANFIAQHPAIVQAVVGIAVAWKVLTVAIELSKAAFESTPWGLIITGIVVGAALIIRYWTPISHFFEDVWNHIYSGFIKPLVAFFVNTVPHAFGVTLNWVEKNWPLLIGIVAGPLGEIVGLVIKYHTQIANTFTTLWNEVRTITVGAWEAVKSYLGSVWGNLVNGLKTDLSVLKAALSAAWNWCKNITVTVWNDVRTYYGALWNSLVAGLKTDLSVLKSVLSAAWNWCKNITVSAWGAVRTFFVSVWNAIIAGLKTSLSGLKAGLSAAWNWCRTITSTVWEAIKGYFSAVWNAIRSAFTVSLSAIRSSVSAGWNAIFGTTKSVFGAVESFFDGFWKRLTQGFTNTVNGIKDAWGKVSGAVQQPLKWMDNNVYAPFAHLVNSGLGIFGVSAKLPAHLIAQKAVGGSIEGAGTGISDQVPIMASDGEYILKAPAVRKIGKRNLDNLNGNSGRSANTERYATGGQVVNDATKWKGHQYIWGGPANPTNGWDCSSFMSYILGKDQVPLPGGFKVGPNGSSQHGPVASQFRSSQPKNVNKTSPGDVAVEKSGGHVGMVISQGGKNQVQGFAAKGKAYGTVPQVFGKDSYDFYQVPGVNNQGLAGQALDWMKQGLGWLTGSSEVSALTDAASSALSGISGLLGKTVPGNKNTIPPQLATGVAKQFLNAGTSKVNANPLNWLSGTSSIGDSDVGSAVAGTATQGSETANGRAIYNYLLAHLFNGNKIAAAGATASIGGESSWNPSSQGTGGRGLIGWTPPSAISDAAFKSGLTGQLPAIIDFVNKSGDQGVIADMMKATSVLEAANEWGKGVERYGINDVHSQYVSMATGFMGGKFGGGNIHTPAGTPKADKWNVNVADGEKVLTRSQAQNYGTSDPTVALLTAIASKLDTLNQVNALTAQNTGNSANGLNGIGKNVRRH